MRRLSLIRSWGLLVTAACIASLLLSAHIAAASETVYTCDASQLNSVWNGAGLARAVCQGGVLAIDTESSGGTGTAGSLTANAPAGLAITGTPMRFVEPTERNSSGAAASDDEWETQYAWSGGSLDVGYPAAPCPELGIGALPCGWSGALPKAITSSTFSMALTCVQSSCPDAASDALAAPDLVVAETQQPTLAAATGSAGSKLGWVRGTWPLSLSGDSPSGLCSISATLNGLGVAQQTSSQSTGTWKQCSLTALTGNIDTTKFPNGVDNFAAQASSAAGNTASVSQDLDVDNSTPSVTLSGPADVPVGSGPAQLTATASAGPSGVGEIDCSVDGVSETFPEGGQSPATATVAFTGLGAHSASCQADNTAQATDGSHGWSSVATGGMTVRTPTAALASFSKLVDKRVCHAVSKRIEVPAGWHEIRWHGHKVRARLPAHKVQRKVRQCRAHLVKRRIVVFETVRRHGREVRVKRHRIVRVPVAPHTVLKGIRTVRFGRTTTLRGTLQTTSEQALAGQPVTILGVARNTHRNFTPLTIATTNADGTWRAKIPRGPGRILEATYGGAPTTEPTTSDQVRTIVHAKVNLAAIHPGRVPWHGKIVLRGALPGGHIPHRGINVRLEYGLGHHSTTYAVRQHVGARRHDRFAAHFEFGAGPARAHARFFFRVCTLPSAGYPFAVGCSKKRYVNVGGHPHAPGIKTRAHKSAKNHHK